MLHPIAQMTWPRTIASSTRALDRPFLRGLSPLRDDRLRFVLRAIALPTMAAFFANGRSTATASSCETLWISARSLPLAHLSALSTRSCLPTPICTLSPQAASPVSVCERSSISWRRIWLRTDLSGAALTRLLANPEKSCRHSSDYHRLDNARYPTCTRNDGRSRCLRSGLLTAVAIPLLAVLVALAFIALATLRWDAWVGHATIQTTNDAYVRAELTRLSSRVAGEVLTVAAKDFQRVKAADLLVQIDPADYQAQVAQAEAGVAGAQA